jgi:methylated-DNA-protein-cysteine methyltransferase-like protein
MRRSVLDGSGRSAEPGKIARLRPRVLAVVAAIPEGRVATYGAIGRHLGATARQVAYVLASFTAEESAALPWFRVVAANGVVSSIKLGAVGRMQIRLLREDGVVITPRNTVAEFERVVWSPG